MSRILNRNILSNNNNCWSNPHCENALRKSVPFNRSALSYLKNFANRTYLRALFCSLVVTIFSISLLSFSALISSWAQICDIELKERRGKERTEENSDSGTGSDLQDTSILVGFLPLNQFSGTPSSRILPSRILFSSNLSPVAGDTKVIATPSTLSASTLSASTWEARTQDAGWFDVQTITNHAQVSLAKISSVEFWNGLGNGLRSPPC